MRAAPAGAGRDPRASSDQAGGLIGAIATSESQNSQTDLDRAFDAAVRLRAKARTAAFLFQYGYLCLEAVNAGLQRYAIRSGCVDEIGNAEVQEIIASAFDDIDLEPADLDDARSK